MSKNRAFSAQFSAGSAWFLGAYQFLSTLTSALTPALSPRRGGIIRRALGHATSSVVVRLTANDTEAMIATRIEKFSSAVTVLTLSLGERACLCRHGRQAGVRARDLSRA